jgi:hypothetical protein
MRYTVAVDALGLAGTVTWDHGRLAGDPWAVQRLELEALRLDGQLVGPGAGPYTRTAHLTDPLSAFFVMQTAFERVQVLEGDVPLAPEVEPDALA